ncbi:PEBP-like protein [Phanerochaete sordida]|uniref:PEBP-like protein n=1 Tax=Phanerochaete sordida TaxID=48140 RepID=A0A9P3GYP9_9APHY|nr:PEBP-like protein [Phanerochaete sordida]
MKFSAAFVSVALAALAAAQANNTELGVEAIEAHFSNAGIVPSLLASFDPVGVLSLSYSGVGDISPGQSLTKDQVGPTPVLAVTPANSTVQLTGNFTLVMADAGPVGTDETAGQTRHWLVNGVTLTGSSPLNVSTSAGVAITDYAGPAPAAGSGAHRYVILLYTQPDNFTAPDGLDTPNVGVSVFNLADYVQSSNLGSIVAGTYITVEEGTASVTPSATSAVVTSTLPAAHSSSASSTAPPSPSTSGTTANKSNGAGSVVTPLSSVFVAALFGLGFVFF